MHLSRAEVNSLWGRNGNACRWAMVLVVIIWVAIPDRFSGPGIRWGGDSDGELIIVVDEDIMKNHVV